ncbi:hypothetical protein ENSA5_44420 [Enhygromyxa salina]|uniref:Uncharacterized protein n=1 Tax=Enhygromyxa salina TaxID=215803 RepID=A0A2S9XJY8_9BACT|nr:hypothetical protein [Enhygromyxa salina]PRP93175.1 hypothetical protein ENSA5_44420 [Enhygromyxa salina]
MDEHERGDAFELRGRPAALAITLVVISLGGGSLLGWSYAGPLGGLLGVLIGAAIGALAFTIIRVRASAERLADPPAPDVRELPPDQAMQVLSALMTASASGSYTKLELSGGLLGEIAKARSRFKGGDLDGALAKLRALAEEHPRSPAVPAEIARILAGEEGHESERRKAAASAISLALHGGMNRLAGKIYREVDELEREHLTLEAKDWERLAQVFTARDDEETAAACRRRAELKSG